MQANRTCARLGFVMSGAATPLASALDVLELSGEHGHLFLRRPCAAETVGMNRGMTVHRVFEAEPSAFSSEVLRLARETKVDVLFFLFDRLVSEALFTAIPCVNVHPSLLPSFTGFRAVERALDGGSQVIGVTAHLISGGIDDGPILVQTARAIGPHERNMKALGEISFLQKTLVLAVSMELTLSLISAAATSDHDALRSAFSAASTGTLSTNPGLGDPSAIQRFMRLQARSGYAVDSAYAPS